MASLRKRQALVYNANPGAPLHLSRQNASPPSHLSRDRRGAYKTSVAPSQSIFPTPHLGSANPPSRSASPYFALVTLQFISSRHPLFINLLYLSHPVDYPPHFLHQALSPRCRRSDRDLLVVTNFVACSILKQAFVSYHFLYILDQLNTQ